jgi:hypothetical protein
MTVAELIARLGVFDPDLKVVMPGEETDFCEVQAAYRDLVAWVDGEVQLSDERDTDRVPVVRLFGADGD